MARKKRKNNDKELSTSNVEEVVEVEIEYVCPKRGKVKQRVKMKRLKPVRVDQPSMILTSDYLSSLERSNMESEEEEQEQL